VTAPYSPEHERSIHFDDSDLAIEWPITQDVQLSVKDGSAPSFADLVSEFTY
jgi:dTDP-4-dehydrorhamnose 3,5-epimerase